MRLLSTQIFLTVETSFENDIQQINGRKISGYNFNVTVDIEDDFTKEIVVAIDNDLDTQKKFGWLQDKTVEDIRINQVIIETESGRYVDAFKDGKFIDYDALTEKLTENHSMGMRV